jgi:putative ABC transport system permease protein
MHLAWQGLLQRKVRTLLTLVGVAVCVLALTTVTGMLRFLRARGVQDAARFANRLLVQSPGAGYPPFLNTLRQESVATITEYDGVLPEQSTPLLFLVIEPPENPMDVAGITGLGLWPGHEQAWLDGTAVVSGRATLAGEGDQAVILGSQAADFYGVSSAGETIAIAHHDWRVVGILESTGLNVVDTLVVMPLGSAQAAFGTEGWISAVLLTVQDGQADEVARVLSATYTALEVNTQADIERFLASRLEMPANFLGILSWAAFIIAALIMANIMNIAVRERTQDITLIQAIGGKRTTILSYTLSEALILCLIGGAFGVLAAVPAAYLLDWAWILSWEEVLRVVGLVIIAGLLAALYPTFQAIRVYPQALRYDELQRQMEQVAAEKRALDQAYRHQVRGREEERERLARDLHDQAIQRLVGLKFHLAEKAPDKQAELQPEVNEVIETLRELCTDLRPPALEQMGLVASLRSYVNDFAERTGQPVELRIQGQEQRLTPDVELSLFRVAQEALSNAWRHAQTPKVELGLNFEPQAVRLTVCDRGRGFEVPERLGALAESGHFGLVGIHERVQLAGGELQLASRPGEGTTITVSVPLPSTAN